MDYHKSLPFIVISISILVIAALACTAITGNQGNNSEPIPVCTPPLCVRNETFACQGDCPGGCGTFCAMFTPAPHPMYTLVAIADVKLSGNSLEISVDVPGIEGDFYGVVSRENFECEIWQPERFPERLICKGNLWFSEGTQTLRVYRTSNDQQAFSIDFTVP